MFLFDNRGYWWWCCLSFAKVQCGIKEVYFVGFCCFGCILHVYKIKHTYTCLCILDYLFSLVFLEQSFSLKSELFF